MHYSKPVSHSKLLDLAKIMFFRFLVVWCLVTGLVFNGPTLASGQEKTIPPLFESLRLEQILSFCGEAVPMEDSEVRERMEKELLLSLWDRDQADFMAEAVNPLSSCYRSDAFPSWTAR